MSNAKLLHAQCPVISQETCKVLAQCKLCLHHCSFDASVVHDAVNNFHFLFNFATVCIKWKIYAQLHNKQTKYWKWTIHSHLQKKQAHNKVCYEQFFLSDLSDFNAQCTKERFQIPHGLGDMGQQGSQWMTILLWHCDITGAAPKPA